MCLWLVYKFNDNNCLLRLFSEFIQTQKRYPTSLDKISILTWKAPVISSQNFSSELNSQRTCSLTITLANEKKFKVHEYVKKFLVGTPTVREVAKFLGNLSALFEAVAYGRLLYRFIEIDKKIHWNFPKRNLMHLVYYLLLPRMKFVGGNKIFKIPLEKWFQHQL